MRTLSNVNNNGKSTNARRLNRSLAYYTILWQTTSHRVKGKPVILARNRPRGTPAKLEKKMRSGWARQTICVASLLKNIVD